MIRLWARAVAAALAVPVLTLVAARTASAQSFPTLTAPVNDFAHVIDAASAAELDKRIRALQAASGDVVVVVTVDTIAPEATVEEYAVKLFERAGIGKKGKDNGALVLLAVKERRVRIEVGYDLEEFITDGFSGQIIRESMLPAFRQGQYGAGLLDGTTRVIQRVADRRGVTLDGVPRPAAAQPRQQLPAGAIIVGLVVLFLILRATQGRGGGSGFGPGGPRRGGPWSGWHGGLGGFGGGGFGGGFGGFGGGGGGGGFGGFGGGRSGGGGASGGW